MIETQIMEDRQSLLEMGWGYTKNQNNNIITIIIIIIKTSQDKNMEGRNDTVRCGDVWSGNRAVGALRVMGV